MLMLGVGLRVQELSSAYSFITPTSVLLFGCPGSAVLHGVPLAYPQSCAGVSSLVELYPAFFSSHLIPFGFPASIGLNTGLYP